MARLGRAQPFKPLTRGIVPSAAGSPDVTVAISGLALSVAQGALIPNNSLALSGLAANGSIGTLTPGTSLALTGIALTGGQGSVGQGTFISGLQLAIGQGSVGTTGGDAAVTPVAPTVGGSGKRRVPRRRVVEIDGEYFEVATEQQGIELLQQVREQARIAAEKAAAAAVAKAETKPTPAGRTRVLAPKTPQLRLLNADYADPFVQQLQAQVDAAQAAVSDIYAEAYRAAALRHAAVMRAEEAEIAAAIDEDDKQERAMVDELLQVINKRLKRK